MKKKYRHDGYYRLRRIRTTQEHRVNGKRSDPDYKWARAKRCGKNLPNSWDDITTRPQKTWKVKREKQYRDEKRGKKHVIQVGLCFDEWKLTQYFEEHDIPYVIKDIKEQQTRTFKVMEQRVVRTVPQFIRVWDKNLNKIVKGHQIGYRDIYEWVETDKTRTSTHCYLLGYEITWWTDTNIGIDYIIG